jgi:3-oxoacyl-[acyl-carrier-protein] synthase-3
MDAYIVGSGVHLPERIVSNEEIAERLGLRPNDIFRLSGIRYRHWVSSTIPTSLLASLALKRALENADVVPSDIDYLLFGTMTPDRFIPGSSSALQRLVGLREIPALDIRAACCNALYGLHLAGALIVSGLANTVAVSLAEIQSPLLELSPHAAKSSILFGDGAAAIIVSKDKRESCLQIIDVFLATDGAYSDELGVRVPGTEFGMKEQQPGDSSVRMEGEIVIRHASRRVVEACESVLQRNSLTIEDIRWLVPHQANLNLLRQIARNLNFSSNRGTLVSVLEESGNTSSASMGIALDKLRRSNQLEKDDYILLPAFGAGFTWGAGLCQVR